MKHLLRVSESTPAASNAWEVIPSTLIRDVSVLPGASFSSCCDNEFCEVVLILSSFWSEASNSPHMSRVSTREYL